MADYYDHDVIVTQDQRYIIVLNAFERYVYDEDSSDNTLWHQPMVFLDKQLSLEDGSR